MPVAGLTIKRQLTSYPSPRSLPPGRVQTQDGVGSTVRTADSHGDWYDTNMTTGVASKGHRVPRAPNCRDLFDGSAANTRRRWSAVDAPIRLQNAFNCLGPGHRRYLRVSDDHRTP